MPSAPYQRLSASKRAPIEQMLGQAERPSLAQVMKTVREAHDGGLPAENPFGSSGISNHKLAIADIVAQLEHAFPGGQWLPLGRDAVVIADLLDGFYTSIGQPTRVRRLDASGKSFPHYRDATSATYETDRPIIYGFLKSNGLDLTQLAGKAPYVMIDVTGYSPTSQSTQLVRSVYRTWAEQGGDPKALYDRVNFVGIPMGSPRTYISDAKDIDAEKARIKASTTSEGPPELLYLKGPFGSLTYTSFWHDDFLKFTSDGKGRVTAPVGHLNSERERRNALAELYDIGKLTSSAEFLTAVKQAASSKYGFEFPLTQTEHLKRAPRVIANPSLVTSSGSARSTSERTESTYLSALKVRLAGPGAKEEIALEFLKDMAGMWARKSASEADVAQAVHVIQQHIDLDDKALDREVFAIYQRHPGFGLVVRTALRQPAAVVAPAAPAPVAAPAPAPVAAPAEVASARSVWGGNVALKLRQSGDLQANAAAITRTLAERWGQGLAHDGDVAAAAAVLIAHPKLDQELFAKSVGVLAEERPNFVQVLRAAMAKVSKPRPTRSAGTPVASSAPVSAPVPAHDLVARVSTDLDVAKDKPQQVRLLLHVIAEAYSHKTASEIEIASALVAIDRHVRLKDPALGLPWSSFNFKHPGFNAVLSELLPTLR